MSKTKKKSRNKKARVISFLLLLSLLLLTIGAFYVVFLGANVLIRCQGSRWDIPSKVYSAPLILYPGINFKKTGLYKRLENLNYIQTKTIPAMPGEFSIRKGIVYLYQRAFLYSDGQQETRLVKIYHNKGIIQKIIDTSNRSMLGSMKIAPVEISTFYGEQREERYLVVLDQIPEDLINATLVLEDRRFFTHIGLDFKGIIRAFSKNILSGRIREGGSTITQQLVKNLFLSPKKTYWRKFNEAIMAMILEAYYTKDEILEMYFNEVYLGQKGSVEIHGVGEAARFYFGRPVEKLTLDQCALLAGLIRAPSHYSPYNDAKAAKIRRNLTLKILFKEGKISKKSYETAISKAVKTVGFVYGKQHAPYYVDYAIAQIKDLYPRETLSSIGINIYTTLDMQIQRWSKEAVVNGLTRLEKNHPHLVDTDKLQAAVVVMEPSTGRILAMVGGRDYQKSQFNRATQAYRQSGSLIKPLVYAQAIISGYNESSLVMDEPISINLDDNTIWSPSNFNDKYFGEVPLLKALSLSLNSATVRLAMNIGLEDIYNLSQKTGLGDNIRPIPSMALGSCEVTPLEMARFYSIFASNGLLNLVRTIHHLTDKDGNQLEMKRIRIHNVMDPAICSVMTNMLQCVTAYGSGRSLAYIGIKDAAGKTGTSNDGRDAWFAGYINGYLAIVWVGSDDNTPLGLSGSEAALPIWGEIMHKIITCYPPKGINIPMGIFMKKICFDSGGLPKRGCPNIWNGAFKSSEDIQNLKKCNIH